MKLIRSVIRPTKLDEVKAALSSVNVVALTVAEVRDYAPAHARGVAWRGHEYTRDDLVRLDLSVIVDDEDVDNVVAAIVTAARTEYLADGWISVLPVEHRYNIHTGIREVL